MKLTITYVWLGDKHYIRNKIKVLDIDKETILINDGEMFDILDIKYKDTVDYCPLFRNPGERITVPNDEGAIANCAELLGRSELSECAKLQAMVEDPRHETQHITSNTQAPTYIQCAPSIFQVH